MMSKKLAVILCIVMLTSFALAEDWEGIISPMNGAILNSNDEIIIEWNPMNEAGVYYINVFRMGKNSEEYIWGTDRWLNVDEDQNAVIPAGTLTSSHYSITVSAWEGSGGHNDYEMATDCIEICVSAESASCSHDITHSNDGNQELNNGINAETIKVFAQGYMPGPLLTLNNEVANKMDEVNWYNFFEDHPVKAITLGTGEIIMWPGASEKLGDQYQKYYEEAALVTLYYLCKGHRTEAEQYISALTEVKDAVDLVDFYSDLLDLITKSIDINSGKNTITFSEVLDENIVDMLPTELRELLRSQYMTFDLDGISKYFKVNGKIDAKKLGDTLCKLADAMIEAALVNTYRKAIVTSLSQDIEDLLLNSGNDNKYNEVFKKVLTDLKSDAADHYSGQVINCYEKIINGIETPVCSVLLKSSVSAISNKWDWQKAEKATCEFVSKFLEDVWLPAKAAKLGFNVGTSTVEYLLFNTEEIGLQMRNYALGYITLANARAMLLDTIAATPDMATEDQLKELYQAYDMYYQTVDSVISIGYKLIGTIHSSEYSSRKNGGSESVTAWSAELSDARELITHNKTMVDEWYLENCISAMT